MKAISIDGVIGWDVLASDIQTQLNESMGEDVEIHINSGGGSVYHGIAIFNYIRDYASLHNVKIIIDGLAASAASYIALAGNQKPVIHDNSIFMIHNPWSFTIGDHREMDKMSEMLKGMTNLFIRAYSKTTDNPEEKIKNWMNNEKFFFGKEILDNGFASEIIEIDEDEEKDASSLIAMAKLNIENCLKTAKEKTEDNYEKIAALIKDTAKANLEKPEENNTQATEPARAGKNKNGGKTVNTLEELRAENLDLYSKAIQAGIDQGIKQEQERVKAHAEWLDVDKENATKAILEGEEFTMASLSKYTKAQAKVHEVNAGVNDNPEGIKTPVTDDPEANEEKETENFSKDYLAYRGHDVGGEK